ncbi:probable disease resistance protein At4g27220 [Fagus crenata]
MNGQVILPEVNRKAEKKTQEIDAEKRKDLVIALEVEQWVQMVDNISQGLQRFIDEDKMCLDLKSRYSLSRKAMKKTLAIEKLLSDAPSLNKMSCPSPAQGIGSSSIEGFKDFESRISMIKEVLEALRDDNINMIAICARGLVQLQGLEIFGCGDMEEIFSKEGEDEKAVDMIKFPMLTHISLLELRRLIGFCKPMDPVELVQPSHAKSTQPSSNLEDKMTDNQDTGSFPESRPISSKLFSSKTILWTPNLENLHIYYIDLLEVVFDLEGLKVDDDRQTITTLVQLKILTLELLNYLTDVWKNVPQEIQVFQNLRSIEVSKCCRLRYIFPLFVAKLLVELQSIKLKKCDVIEDIVQRDGEEEAADFTLFPKVSSFIVEELPNLVTFCKEAYSLEWSSMRKIRIFQCNKFKTIGSEIRRPSKLKEINRELDSRPQEPGLGSFSSNLTKPEDPKARDIDNPSKIWYLFSSHIIECFKNLEEIDLRSCTSLEAIFQIEELAIEESHVASVLDQLRKLKLIDLPKLMHIWKKGPERIMGFGNLRSLKVEECNNLTYLFSPSIAKLLVMLEEIEVMHCQKIEEILARAREEEGEEKEIVLFNKVNSFVLMDLPNLKCFCNEANALEWPSLKKVGVIRCPNLRTFVPTNIKTPEPEGVYEDYDFDFPFQKYNFKRPAQWKGDLNATIDHIFKGKVWHTLTTNLSLLGQFDSYV